MRETEPNITDFDELLSYLPLLYASDFKPIRRWHGLKENDNLFCPHAEYEDIVIKFFETVARECWVDYVYSVKNVDKIIHDPQSIACATLGEIRALLTWCERGERFGDGHWGGVIEKGLVRNILLRLRELHPHGAQQDRR
ncbi:MAG: DUF6508 domain-containing protein [Methylicorpusculum sp.]|uniref:DUF6508 domain-containing protein n=1 Tax=Methylicorpusculum sp. TaxID=2713644 RepID=UPI002717CB26|nr:DUF6508 domain-containing protein [Methylicorpusculum sp.]MDO8941085.1 DUF6508 domain-containing protein [Methylicorpusculum sp.]MDP2202316.1 DUF6508 domain-containing protein [Methylicorpusculum sp.]